MRLDFAGPCLPASSDPVSNWGMRLMGCSRRRASIASSPLHRGAQLPQSLPQACQRVVELCACRPFLVQSLCNRVFEQVAAGNSRTVTLDIVEEAATGMVRDNEHFPNSLGLRRNRAAQTPADALRAALGGTGCGEHRSSPGTARRAQGAGSPPRPHERHCGAPRIGADRSGQLVPRRHVPVGRAVDGEVGAGERRFQGGCRREVCRTEESRTTDGLRRTRADCAGK